MNQPPLDHHYLVAHLGGDKHVVRTGGLRTITRDVRMRGYSTIEAGQAYRWRTRGPIAFGHVYLEPEWYARTIAEQFDRDPARVVLREEVGGDDRLIGSLLAALVMATDVDDMALMQQEMQLEAVLHRLYEHQEASVGSHSRVSISPSSVRRVSDYILDHLGSPITLDELAKIAGYSRFHFARGFRAAIGMPPYTFIVRQRVARACELLGDRSIPIGTIAAATGFASHAQFSTRFRQVTGLPPSLYRRLIR